MLTASNGEKNTKRPSMKSIWMHLGDYKFFLFLPPKLLTSFPPGFNAVNDGFMHTSFATQHHADHQRACFPSPVPQNLSQPQPCPTSPVQAQSSRPASNQYCCLWPFVVPSLCFFCGPHFYWTRLDIKSSLGAPTSLSGHKLPIPKRPSKESFSQDWMEGGEAKKKQMRGYRVRHQGPWVYWCCMYIYTYICIYVDIQIYHTQIYWCVVYLYIKTQSQQ